LLGLDVRDLDQEKIDTLFSKMRDEAEQIGQASGTRFSFHQVVADKPALTDPCLRQIIADAAKQLNLSTKLLPSGATHDAQSMARLAPAGMISRRWLTLYHGVRHTPSGCLYRLGLALFGLENPEKCLLRGDSWIFGPETDYERLGDVKDVVFPCGYTMDQDGDTVNIYYGAADCSIALARASVRALLVWLDANGSYEGGRRLND